MLGDILDYIFYQYTLYKKNGTCVLHAKHRMEKKFKEIREMVAELYLCTSNFARAHGYDYGTYGNSSASVRSGMFLSPLAKNSMTAERSSRRRYQVSKINQHLTSM